MIKYARGGRSIPHERVFKLDNDNLVGNKISVLIGDKLVKYLGAFRSIECVNFYVNLFPDLQHIMWKKRGKAHSFTFTNTCKFS